MIDVDSTNPALDAADNEQTLVDRARGALSNCNWVVGECAGQWTEKYARGRTDADFGNLIGLSADQVYQRRRVWETFHDVQAEYPALKWSHFYVALNWDDAPECLSWAQENEATVAEMRAWRRSVHGEDLTAEPDPNSLQLLDYNPTDVRHPSEFAGVAGGGESDAPFEATGSYSGEREQTPYSPYRKDARGDFQGAEGEEHATAARPAAPAEQDSPLRTVKRALSSLRRAEQQLSELTEEDYQELSPETINQLWDLYDDLGRAIKRRD
ncbi:hypothetical protein [Rubinisphaera margarita]|uniref:hypothetical protein n=1 Tax=Rubinisphaera margarita TaxID=2909586 RepID=UPI001EE7BF5F|nr:hypothetical protein [Rubinisphaera margarita]MCG6154571.1 hypothetical protein [Rubinisphaera margarita]